MYLIEASAKGAFISAGEAYGKAGRCAMVAMLPGGGGQVATLTEEQKGRFVRDGFLHVAGVVPRRVLTRARRAINHSLGAGIDRNDLVRFNNQTSAPSCERIRGC